MPIVNENDTVVTEEIKLGDNDTLAAMVANLLEADLLVILTDQLGLFTDDPRLHPSATMVSEVSANDPDIALMAGGAGSEIGTGGMATKVRAARRAANSGAHTLIASGHEQDVLLRLAAREPVGSLLYADIPRLSAREQWLADHLQLRGQLQLDAGAAQALLRDGKSLLPVGVVDVVGQFERGDVVACLDPQGREIARGLVNYSAQETRRIRGLASSQIEAALGFVEESELMHRDNLVFTSSGGKR